MLIRISLILAIVAGLAAAALNVLQVKENITTTLANLAAEKSAKEEALNKLSATNRVLAATAKSLTATKEELSTAKKDLAASKDSEEQAVKRATTLTDDLKKMTEDRDKKADELAAWRSLSIPIDTIRATLASVKQITEERDAVEAEKKIILANYNRLDAKLKAILDPDSAPELPEGLRGKVLAVDPRYDFVLLDIGGNQGVKERGEMLVNRNGKLEAKVKITSVLPDRCIANVMPGWRLGDVMEGDQVIY